MDAFVYAGSKTTSPLWRAYTQWVKNKTGRVFTLTPLLTGVGQSRFGGILTEAAKLVDDGKLRPLLSEPRFPPAELEAAFSLVKTGSIGKVVVEM